jgi:hypothetical protein
VVDLRRFAHDAENGATVGARRDIVVDMRSMLAASILPSARNGVGAIGKTPLASTESIVISLCLDRRRFRDDEGRAALLASEREWRKFRTSALYWGRNLETA